jgi:mannobiose 2-epimerase
MVAVTNKELLQYKTELNAELDAILSWWMKYMIDDVNGGFYGSVNNNNESNSSTKGVVLNSRILWTFSTAYLFKRNDQHLKIAGRAFEYITEYFLDRKHGGVFWSVDQNGKIHSDKKQAYGLAFCIYSLAEYYKASNNDSALKLAIEIFDSMEKYSFDKRKNGYIEAFTRDWKHIDDMRLSAKDNNERKTANTHLHIIEAYTNLYSCWPQDLLNNRIIHLMDLFINHFINQTKYHLNLFFDDDWDLKSTLLSFGHDIEASWLLQQYAETIGEEKYIEQFRRLAIRMTDAATEGLDSDGGLWYEYEAANDRMVYEKHSWPQAEAMIGFFNAWQLTYHDKYLQHSLNSWGFVKKHIRDNVNGEWFWGVNRDYSVMKKEKAGFWKCPYHTSRACIELIKRIDSINNK